ncbi:uncharacterized protein LOC130193284 isoform X1 [Pseudoliparis swirei]|uniref:uncharacterized protein LOC130193284 isoform X1 n=1 Tax=Pseudoliparis swirei TaxID=2059687 RepID=UPI0024BDB4B7|nr:uncharacterized protein LOC130193284 isoform X1 [Pseudoliparis swirei]XP_056269723.1 uncharacterized protein LOC130193284 isoform X1 [Pseudoliparis swirei]
MNIHFILNIFPLLYCAARLYININNFLNEVRWRLRREPNALVVDADLTSSGIWLQSFGPLRMKLLNTMSTVCLFICELFQAQAMTGVVRWNFRRLVDLKLPGVELPAVFDPVLIAELNNLSPKVTAKAKYPALQVTNRDTGERFGLDYVERCCRPVPLNWDKHKTQPSMAAAVAKETEHPAAVEATDRQETSATVREAPSSLVPILSFHEGSDVKFQPPWRPSSDPAPLPVSSSPYSRSHRTDENRRHCPGPGPRPVDRSCHRRASD